MIVGVMQPYLFPYLGYFQLAYHCDKFVFYDDVNFIKGGYINRNNILSNDKKQLFTLPVLQASSFKKINELSFQANPKKILRTIEQSYAKSPFIDDVMPLIEDILNSTNKNVAVMAGESITKVFEYLGIKKDFYFSSDLEYDRAQTAAEKLYSICGLFDADKYCNTLGGQALYSKDQFLNQGIELSFIEMKALSYKQNNDEFVSHLSIIDVLMWNSRKDIKSLLNQFRLI